jgi:hypothetical protein
MTPRAVELAYLPALQDVPMRILNRAPADPRRRGRRGIGRDRGDFGDRHLWAVVVGGGAIFFGIGMLMKGAMRMAIFALGGLLLMFGVGMGLFDAFS